MRRIASPKKYLKQSRCLSQEGAPEPLADSLPQKAAIPQGDPGHKRGGRAVAFSTQERQAILREAARRYRRASKKEKGVVHYEVETPDSETWACLLASTTRPHLL